MDNNFNKFIKNGLLISFGTLLVAILVATSYAKSHHLYLNNIFSHNFNFSGINWYNSSSYDYDYKKSNSNTSRLFEENNFDVKENIEIHANIETIEFSSEDRDDILVTFDREVIDSNNYRVTYKAYETNDTIIISSTMDSYALTNMNLDGTIKITVPDDYECDTLKINTSLGKINNKVLPSDLDNLIIDADIAEIELDIDQPLKKLSIDNDLGYLSLDVNDEIEHVSIKNDSSAIDVSASANIDQMYIQTNAGSVTLDLDVSPNTLKVETDLGNIEVDYQEPVEFLEVYSSLGNIEIDVPTDDPSKVYKKSDLSSFSSDLETTSVKNDSNIIIEIDLGSVEIDAVN